MSEFAFYPDYSAAERVWQAADKVEFRGIEQQLSFKVDAASFIALLEELHMVTKDERFRGAKEALYEHNIARGYGWAGGSPFQHVNGIERQFERKAIDLVNDLHSHGVTLRLAFANAAANLRWPGNSFAAAVKSVERLYRADGGHTE